MAEWIKCVECGADVSSHARECQKCHEDISGYVCSVCRKREKKQNLQVYKWYDEDRKGYSCCEDSEKQCIPEKCLSYGVGCYRFAHPECLALVYNKDSSVIFTCPLCHKEYNTNFGWCTNCGHPYLNLEMVRCSGCMLLVIRSEARHVKSEYSYQDCYYHKVCYGFFVSPQCNATKCFIATSLYGEDSSKVQMLCFFRDEYLSASSLGRAFIALYVRFSPPLARAIAKESLLRTLVRYCIVAPALLFTEKFFAYAGRKENLKQWRDGNCQG